MHPTGLVDPKEPDAKVKFLAAEALRGVGGLLLDNEGQRFADELGHRDYVTGKMWENGKVRVLHGGGPECSCSAVPDSSCAEWAGVERDRVALQALRRAWAHAALRQRRRSR